MKTHKIKNINGYVCLTCKAPSQNSFTPAGILAHLGMPFNVERDDWLKQYKHIKEQLQNLKPNEEVDIEI